MLTLLLFDGLEFAHSGLFPKVNPFWNGVVLSSKQEGEGWAWGRRVVWSIGLFVKPATANYNARA